MDKKRPISHEKNVTGSGNAYKRGSGLGTGPVGTTNGRRNSSGSSGGGVRKAGISTGGAVILLILYLFGKNFLGGILPSSDSGSSDGSHITGQSTNTAKPDTSVASGAREKYTQLLGNGQDEVTIMVYLCGTDLESKSGMATADLKEMTSATIGTNVNLIVYTGGCTKWQNDIISSNKNQIYQIKDGGIVCLEKDMGSASMTNPDTLSSFINYCKKNFPANRNELILWDHGGGSITGYGYDEKNKNSGSMNLAGIRKALSDTGMTFDFIGFDACLMATLETAMTLTPYADYLIASEETEPGVGWYYTNWLTSLSQNTSMPTVEVGKMIVDDFVDVCNQKCRGQKTTLSVVDLAELEKTVPSEFSAFAKSTNELIQNQDYKTVSDARYNSREFAVSSKIDQVDLVNLAENMGTVEGRNLADAIKGAVKYNKTASCITNAYGLAIYFPYKKTSQVDRATSVYDQIGMDAEYSRCIKEFAGLEIAGQQTSGGQTSPVSILLGGSASNSSSSGGIDSIANLFGQFLGNTDLGFFSDRTMSDEDTVQYLSENHFDPNELVWIMNDGEYKIMISESQWDLVQQLDLNVFVDDGEGFIDLGLDNQFDFDEEGNLLGTYDGTWLAINNQPVAYYHTDTVGNQDDYSMTGYVPALLNGDRVEIILVFDTDNPGGYVAGARRVYTQGETDTVAKSMLSIEEGDQIDFICDYYDYSGNYQDSYYLGEQLTVSGDLQISYVELDNQVVEASYQFTDIYNQHYWTDVIPK